MENQENNRARTAAQLGAAAVNIARGAAQGGVGKKFCSPTDQSADGYSLFLFQPAAAYFCRDPQQHVWNAFRRVS